jgi:hypothetical protein
MAICLCLISGISGKDSLSYIHVFKADLTSLDLGHWIEYFYSLKLQSVISLGLN